MKHLCQLLYQHSDIDISIFTADCQAVSLCQFHEAVQQCCQSLFQRASWDINIGLIQSSGCFVDRWSGWKEDLGAVERGHCQDVQLYMCKAADRQIWNYVLQPKVYL